MDRKTVENLRAMLCEEIEAISKKGTLGTHETLDILKDLIETEKNLGKIEHYDREKEESTALAMPGYSQRKYFIDADYNPMGHSYGYGGRTVYDIDRGSYMYMEPRYGYDDRRYSRTSSKSEMIKELKEMMEETSDSEIKTIIQEALTKLNK